MSAYPYAFSWSLWAFRAGGTAAVSTLGGPLLIEATPDPDGTCTRLCWKRPQAALALGPLGGADRYALQVVVCDMRTRARGVCCVAATPGGGGSVVRFVLDGAHGAAVGVEDIGVAVCIGDGNSSGFTCTLRGTLE